MTGQYLKARLDNTGMRMSAVAEKLGMSAQGLNQLFRADDVKTGIIEKICVALNLPLSYFYEGSGIVVSDNHDSFNQNGDQTMEDLMTMINEQRKRIDHLTDLLLRRNNI